MLGLGVRDLAKAAGVSTNTVSRLERGEELDASRTETSADIEGAATGTVRIERKSISALMIACAGTQRLRPRIAIG